MQSRKKHREVKFFIPKAFPVFYTSQISEWTHIFIDHCVMAEQHWPKAAQDPAGFIWCPANDGYFLPGWVIYLSGAAGTQEFLTLTGNFEKCGLQEYERKEHNRAWWTHTAQSKRGTSSFLKCSLCLCWRSLNEIVYVNCSIWLTPLISIIKRKRFGGEKGRGVGEIVYN